MTSHNFYTILGIPRHADEKAIRAAYRDLARQYHPDSAYFIPTANITFSDITHAYETLRDPIKRARYNATLRASTHPIRRTHTTTGGTTTRPPYSRSSRTQQRQSTRDNSRPPNSRSSQRRQSTESTVKPPPPPKPRTQFEATRFIGLFVILISAIVSTITDNGNDTTIPDAREQQQTIDAFDIFSPGFRNAANPFYQYYSDENDLNNLNTSEWNQTQGTVDRLSPESCQQSGTGCRYVYYHFEVNGRTYHDQFPASPLAYTVGDQYTVHYHSNDPDQSFIVPR